MRAAKIITGLFATSIILLMSLRGLSQNTASVNMKTKVRIYATGIRFDSLVNAIAKQTKAKFSFNTRKITPDKIFMLKPGEQKLEDVLLQIKKKTGIYYKIIGSHIILLDKKLETNNDKQTGNYSKPVTSTPKASSKKASANTFIKKTSGKPPLRSKSKKYIETEYILYEEPTTSGISASDYLPIEDAFRQAASKEITTQAVSKKTDSIKQNSNKDTDSSIMSIEDTSKISGSNENETATGSSIKSAKQKGKKSRDLQFFGGAELLKSTDFTNANSGNLMNGAGINIKAEKYLSNRFSGTLSFAFNQFIGDYTYFKLSTLKDTTIRNFAVAPLLTGLKYYFWKKTYLSAEAGFAFRVSSSTRTHVALAPSSGIMLPLKNKSNIDLGVKLVAILNKKGAQEGTFLESGGHSFFTFRAAYGFNILKINKNKRQEETIAGRKKGNTAIRIKSATRTEGEKRDLQFFAGTELLRTTSLKDDTNSNLSGLGINLMLEKRINQKFSGTLSFGLYHFPGNYIAIYPFPAPADTTTITRFTLDMLALGGRYTFGKLFYLSAEGGVIFKSKVNDRILFMLTPSAGVFFKLKRYNKIDIGLKLYNTLGRVSLYGTPVLETGGYSIFSLRLAYGF